MKKQSLVAAIGTFALAANVLLPGLAFGQSNQTGTADIACNTTNPTFNLTPAAAVTFSGDGAGSAIYAQLGGQQAYNNAAGALTTTTGEDYISVVDVRDPSSAGCNDGLTLALNVIDGSDADGTYFDSAPGAAGGDFLPLDQLYYVTTADTCAAGATENTTNGICFDNSALCGAGDGNPAAACGNTHGTTIADYTGTAFTTLTTFTTDADSALGTAANTPATRNVLVFADGTELFGEAGFGVSYAVDIPANQETGTYVVELQYTVSP